MLRVTNSAAGTAIVAGGAGFVGSHLCERLIAEGYRVNCLDSLLTGSTQNLERLVREPRFTFIEHDVVSPLPAGFGADLVFNLACAASPPLYQIDPVHTMMTNVVGTNNLLAIAAQQGARLFQASTSEVYGNPTVHPQSESYCGNVNPIGPRACYDEGKRAAESLCFDYLRQGKVDVRVARIFNTYGPRLRSGDGRVIPNLVSQALAGLPLTIYGDGSQTRAFCYIDDLVEACMRFMQHEAPPAHPLNLGNPVELPIIDLAKLVRKVTGSASSIVFGPLPEDDPSRRRPDIALARKHLGWEPVVGIERGLEHTVAWFTAEEPSRILVPGHAC
jgi:UDP-glucuronate decarboxylase